jgi:alkylhydroperoxidase/carboxymuconolactone decarboxylase family protein YurZ
MAVLRKLVVAAASAAILASAPGCDWMKKKDSPARKTEKELAEERRERLRRACASDATYDRLKELVFDEAARIRNADPRNLDPLAAASVVRMEKPLVKSRDEDLNVTVCTGKFILELPPGAANAFDGKHRLDAEVEYAAQAAADGSGMVYQMDGAEPIVYRLATFGMPSGFAPRVVEVPQPSAPPAAPPQVAVVEPPPAPPRAAPAPAPAPAAPPPVAKKAAPPEAPQPRTAATPSFSCRYARTRSERLVCSSPGLAARDRQMASIYYAAMAGADPATRAHLRRSRDSFLSRRERCGSEECVAAAYNARIAEIRSIAGGR